MSMRWFPDVNVWLALSLPGHAYHRVVDEWFLSNDQPVYLCRATEQGFLRLLTTAAVLAPYDMAALSNRKALQHVEAFLAMERVLLAEEPGTIRSEWPRLADTNTASPKLWMDAYLAAFALTGGFRLVTTDRGFKQFKGLNALVL